MLAVGHPDGRGGLAGMTGDVGHRLLHDPERGQVDVGGQRARQAVYLYRHGEPGGAGAAR